MNQCPGKSVGEIVHYSLKVERLRSLSSYRGKIIGDTRKILIRGLHMLRTGGGVDTQWSSPRGKDRGRLKKVG